LGHYATSWKVTGSIRYEVIGYFLGEAEGKRTLGRPRRKWVDNIKMDLRETGWNGMDWIDLAQHRDK
jgi:hypothetical protein